MCCLPHFWKNVFEGVEEPFWTCLILFIHELERIYKKHEILDCSFEILEWWWWWSRWWWGMRNRWWWWVVLWKFLEFSPLPIAINTARFYTSTHSTTLHWLIHIEKKQQCLINTSKLAARSASRAWEVIILIVTWKYMWKEIKLILQQRYNIMR